MSNFTRQLVSKLNRLLIFLGLRSNPSFWGVVYDSVTKQPLDPALVKLVEVASGKVVGSCATDLQGHYSFLVFPGKFKILVQRTNYSYPSVLESGDSDGFYKNLYHGEFFEVKGDTDALSLNIPMDPIRPDWNQQAKRKLPGGNPQHERLLIFIASALFWTSLAICPLVYYFRPSSWLLAAFAAYFVILLLWLFLPDIRLWGKIVMISGRGFKNIQVELAHAELPDISMGRAQVISDGKFYLRVPPGKYILKVVEKNETEKTILASKLVNIGWEGTVNPTVKV